MTYPNPWIYNKLEFNSEDIQDFQGFVYEITDTENGKKYIGKKILINKKTRPPLKGKKRKRISYVESDWKNYYGSNPEIKAIAEENPHRFKRKILRLCRSKGEMSYYELTEQLDRGVLFKPDEYYNEIINVRIHRKHITTINEENK